MDLIYMPEVLSYGTLRHPQYRDYEQPWNKDYFNYGKSTTKTKIQQRQQVQKPASRAPCLLCKENKRRSLAAYIRGKARKNSCSEIHEEIEEDQEDEEEEEQTGTSGVELQGEKPEQKTAKPEKEEMQRPATCPIVQNNAATHCE